MTSYSFADCKADIARKWGAMRVIREAEANAAAKKIMKGRAQYEAVEAETGVPWMFVGLTHLREANCDFRGVLHNGEKIVGTGRKTTLVPKGRGPFADWHSAAVDALTQEGLDKVREWTDEFQLYKFEAFNGFGYRMRGCPSAYVWAGTNQYTHGKFVSDGKWSATAVDKQLGCAPVLRKLMEQTAPKKSVIKTVKESPSLRLQLNALMSGVLAVVISCKDWLVDQGHWLLSFLPGAAEQVGSTVGATQQIAGYAGVPLPAKLLCGIVAACLLLLFTRQLSQKRLAND